MHQNVSFAIAFIGGLASFLSPCVLPLVPSYICYITGISFEDLTAQTKQTRAAIIKHSLLFILGFSIIFIAFGIVASYFGQSLLEYRVLIRKIGAVAIIFLGLHLAGVLRIIHLEKHAKLQLENKPLGYFGSVLTGMVFAAGWTPCVGPILSSILLYAATEKVLTSVYLLVFYSLGLGLPLFVLGLLIDNFILFFNKVKDFIRHVSVVTGVLLVIIGILLFTDYFQAISRWSMLIFEGVR